MKEQTGIVNLKRECLSTGLCYECGACEVVCPNGALKMRTYPWCRTPELTADCVAEECDRCYRACAAARVPLTKIEETFFGKSRGKHCFPDTKGNYPDNENGNKAGVYRAVYTGFAADKETHESAVSGGIASAILIYALEHDIIDGAVLAGFDTEKPWEAKAVIATNREEVLAAAGSKYQPHPQLLGLREAAKRGLERIAITGTPCNVLSLRRMMLEDDFRDITGCVKFVISNICGAHWGRHGTENLITSWMGTPLEDVAAIKYRARPFPGDFKIWLKDGSVRDSSFVNSAYGGLAGLAKFTPEECRYCLEKVASCADIVVGDTWHHPYLSPGYITMTDENYRKAVDINSFGEPEELIWEKVNAARKGMTAIVLRSAAGEELFNAAFNGGALKAWRETDAVALQFLNDIHDAGKPISNGPVINARICRNQPVRVYE